MNWRHRVLLAVVVSVCSATLAQATELRIHFNGPGKDKVKIQTAEALLLGWGWAARVPLPFEGDLVRITFDSSEMRSQVIEKYPDLLSARIHVRAESLMPIVSDPFTWIDSRPHQAIRDVGSEQVRVDFRQKQFAMIGSGADAELTVELKRPGERRVKFLDDMNKPVRGLRVAAYMFWSNENRCGTMSGGDLITTGITDKDGRLVLPEGNFEYALKLLDDRVRFSSPDTSDTDGYAALYLTSRETTFYVHWFVSRPLTLRVFTGDTPLRNALISGGRNYCSECGKCSGAIGTTDQNGSLSMERYYPEEFDILCLVDEKGAILWITSSYRLGTATVDVRLPAGLNAPKAVGICPPYR